jgi:antitoxin MazE
MKTTIRRIGNARGVVIPKSLLSQAGIEGEAEIVVEGRSIVIRKTKAQVREGWAEASKRIASESTR